MGVHNHILLGNGFNLALDSKDFRLKLGYECIKKDMIETLKKEDSNQEALNLLEQNCTCDIEEIIECAKKSGDKSVVKLLKSCFILSIIKRTKSSTSFTYDNELSIKKKTASENLKEFDKIFTLNYDLVLYWLLMEENLGLRENFSDGFCDRFLQEDSLGCELLRFYQDRKNTLFYLHGALHLFNYQDKTPVKIVKKGHQLSLIELYTRLLKNYPESLDNLLVVEPSHDDKHTYISRNSYLKWCYNSLKQLDGSLIVYGCSMVDQNKRLKDHHLMDAMFDSNVLNLYLGFYGTESYSDKLILEKCKSLNNKRHNKVAVFEFSTKKFNIWNDKDFLSKILNESQEIH